MQTYINSYLVKNNTVHTFKIFGYSSMGMPGVEVIGMGGQSRLIKEKILYATKLFRKKVKNRRYVLCLEQASEREVLKEDYFWFELPTLILLWTLGEVLPLMNIHECYCSGRLGAKGNCTLYPGHSRAFQFFQKNNLKLIYDKKLVSSEIDKVLELREIFF